MATRTLVFLSGTSAVLPDDFSSPWNVDVYGAGGGAHHGGGVQGGGGAGGGGGFSRITQADLTLNHGQTVFMSIGESAG